MSFGTPTYTSHFPDGSEQTNTVLAIQEGVILSTRKLGKVELVRVYRGATLREGALVSGEVVLEKSTGKVPADWLGPKKAPK